MAGTIGAAALLAFLIEAMLEYIFSIWWKPLANETRKRVIMAAGLVLGIGLSLGYRLDIIPALAALGNTELQPSTIGQVITGALIGRGSEFMHQLYNRYVKPEPE